VSLDQSLEFSTLCDPISRKKKWVAAVESQEQVQLHFSIVLDVAWSVSSRNPELGGAGLECVLCFSLPLRDSSAVTHLEH
jgi:hypothetical protein